MSNNLKPPSLERAKQRLTDSTVRPLLVSLATTKYNNIITVFIDALDSNFNSSATIQEHITQMRL